MPSVPHHFASLHERGHHHFTLSHSKLQAPLHKSAKHCTDVPQIVCVNITSVMACKNKTELHTCGQTGCPLNCYSPGTNTYRYVTAKAISTWDNEKGTPQPMCTFYQSTICALHVTLWHCKSVCTLHLRGRNTQSTLWGSFTKDRTAVLFVHSLPTPHFTTLPSNDRDEALLANFRHENIQLQVIRLLQRRNKPLSTTTHQISHSKVTP